jgi:hypothetical protein
MTFFYQKNLPFSVDSPPAACACAFGSRGEIAGIGK